MGSHSIRNTRDPESKTGRRSLGSPLVLCHLHFSAPPPSCSWAGSLYDHSSVSIRVFSFVTPPGQGCRISTRSSRPYGSHAPVRRTGCQVRTVYDPNPDVTPTHPPAVCRDLLAGIPSLDRVPPRYRGSRRSCPPIPGKTQSPADQLHPNAPSWQPCSLLGFVWRQGIVVWNPEDVMRLRATSRYLHHNWFPFHRHAVILHRDQALSNCRK